MTALSPRAAPTASATTDRLGILASTVCAAHCAVAALLPAAVGAMGLSALLGHEAEWVFTLAAVSAAGFALFSGWRRHGHVCVLLLLGLGIVGLLAARFLEDAGGHMLGTAIAVGSGLALVLGHVQNLRALRAPSDPCCAPE